LKGFISPKVATAQKLYFKSKTWIKTQKCLACIRTLASKFTDNWLKISSMTSLWHHNDLITITFAIIGEYNLYI